FPIEKSKALARKAIAGMRANDTFNVITFAGATSVLWPEPKLATEENKQAADAFVNGAYGSGGTEMMTAINAALVQEGRSGLKPAKLLDLPADGRAVRIVVDAAALVRAASGWTINAGEGRSIKAEIGIAIPANSKNDALLVDGTWETREGDRIFVAKSARFEDADARTRFVFFLTDGYIGNDQAVVQAVRDNARASRVFSFGIGNSVNRFLLEEMARAGRGVCEIVTLSDDADPVIDRLVRRIDAPVLTDIELAIDPALGVHDVLPAGDHLPDLFDAEPIVLMGRFDRAASGEIVVRGRTAAGAWERRVRVDLPAEEAKHDVVKSLWARAKVDDLLLPRLGEVEQGTLDTRTKAAVIRLGEAFSIATPYTSFVAVEKSRVTVGGKPMLVAVPVELPDGTNWAGFFGETVRGGDAVLAEVRRGDGRALNDFAKKLESFSHAQLAAVAIDAAKDPLDDIDRENEKEQFGVRPSSGDSNSRSMMASDPAAASVPPSAAPPVAATGAPVSSAAPAASGKRSILRTEPGSPRGNSGGALPTQTGGANARDQSREMRSDTFSRVAAKPGRPSGSVDGRRGGAGAGGAGAGGATPSAAPLAGGFGGGGSGGGSGGGRGEVLARGRLNEAAVFEKGESKADRAGQTPDDAPSNTSDANVSADNKKLTAVLERFSGAQRETLAKVLDRRLLLATLAALVAEPNLAQILDELGCDVRDGSVLVAMRVTATDEAALALLRTTGCIVESVDAARGMVVARAKPEKIADLALLASVRRIEPIASVGPSTR
ncbi:MAG: hypothetical protein QM516_07035, partial [Limnohabitans sp.]|nr:hypothetical protein [Limnohabitans sp.]